jgi:hypothetical protein
MSGIDGTSRNNNRPRGVAEIFQVRKHVVEFHADDSRHVLTNDPSGPGLLNNSAHFRPEVAVICRASLLPGEAEWLARKSPCNQVGADSANGSDISEVGHGWPITFEDFAGIRFDFTECNGAEAGGIGCERKASYSREQVQVRKNSARPDRRRGRALTHAALSSLGGTGRLTGARNRV